MIPTFINFLCSEKVKKPHIQLSCSVCAHHRGHWHQRRKATRVNAEAGVLSIRLGLKYTFSLFMQCYVSVNTASNTA